MHSRESESFISNGINKITHNINPVHVEFSYGTCSKFDRHAIHKAHEADKSLHILDFQVCNTLTRTSAHKLIIHNSKNDSPLIIAIVVCSE